MSRRPNAQAERDKNKRRQVEDHDELDDEEVNDQQRDSR